MTYFDPFPSTKHLYTGCYIRDPNCIDGNVKIKEVYSTETEALKNGFIDKPKRTYWDTVRYDVYMKKVEKSLYNDYEFVAVDKVENARQNGGVIYSIERWGGKNAYPPSITFETINREVAELQYKNIVNKIKQGFVKLYKNKDVIESEIKTKN